MGSKNKLTRRSFCNDFDKNKFNFKLLVVTILIVVAFPWVIPQLVVIGAAPDTSSVKLYQSEETVDFGWKMIAISFVAILFAVILFANFIAVSIQDKIKQIGILRAIGATKNQISTIFVVQNSIIALFVFIFSSTVINYTIMPLLLLMGTSSKPFPFPLYELQVSDYLFLFVIIIVTSIIASLFPLLRLSRKTPRELMIK